LHFENFYYTNLKLQQHKNGPATPVLVIERERESKFKFYLSNYRYKLNKKEKNIPFRRLIKERNLHFYFMVLYYLYKSKGESLILKYLYLLLTLLNSRLLIFLLQISLLLGV